MKSDFWSGIAVSAFPVMFFTLWANEAGKISDTAFWWAFVVQVSVLIYCTYKAKAFVWQIDTEEVEK